MERRQSIMRRRGKTFLSLLLSAVIVTGQPVLAADFSAGEETFISETTEQEGDVSEVQNLSPNSGKFLLQCDKICNLSVLS